MCNQEIKDIIGKTIVDKDLGLEIETKVHDFNIKCSDIVIPSGWRIPTMTESINILDKYSKTLSDKDWYAFFIEQPSKINKSKGLVAVAVCNFSGELGLNLVGETSDVSDDMGVLLVRDLKKVKRK